MAPHSSRNVGHEAKAQLKGVGHSVTHLWERCHQKLSSTHKMELLQFQDKEAPAYVPPTRQARSNDPYVGYQMGGNPVKYAQPYPLTAAAIAKNPAFKPTTIVVSLDDTPEFVPLPRLPSTVELAEDDPAVEPPPPTVATVEKKRKGDHGHVTFRDEAAAAVEAPKADAVALPEKVPEDAAVEAALPPTELLPPPQPEQQPQPQPQQPEVNAQPQAE
eukprot:EG_transcript_29513